MNHSDFYELMRTKVEIDGIELSALSIDHPTDARHLMAGVVLLALKTNSIQSFIRYFEKLAQLSGKERAEFFLHLQTFCESPELLEVSVTRMRHFVGTFDTDKERMSDAFAEADRVVRIKELIHWTKDNSLPSKTSRNNSELNSTGTALLDPVEQKGLIKRAAGDLIIKIFVNAGVIRQQDQDKLTRVCGTFADTKAKIEFEKISWRSLTSFFGNLIDQKVIPLEEQNLKNFLESNFDGDDYNEGTVKSAISGNRQSVELNKKSFSKHSTNRIELDSLWNQLFLSKE